MKGLPTACVTGENTDEKVMLGVQRGDYCLVFFTPELLITNRKWRNVLTNDNYTARLRGFIIDEAHCIQKW